MTMPPDSTTPAEREIRHGKWSIYPTDPLPPVPTWAQFAWSYTHDDYDGAPDADDGRHGYRRTQIAEMRPYLAVEGRDLTDLVEGKRIRISISEPDLANGSPKPGDMIARNPSNHADQWLVAAEYFAANFKGVEAANSIDHQQRRGAHADIIDEALTAYDDFMKSDDFDPYGALERIMGRMRKRAALYAANPPTSEAPASPAPSESDHGI